jgi:type VI secretion system secreted protein Hcp
MAVDCFLKLGDVKGESRDSAHADEIGILSWSWGMLQSGTTHLGPGGGGGKANVNDLSLTIWIDKSYPTLVQACCAGQHFPTATLTCRKASGDSAVPYVKLEMEEVLVTSVSAGGSGSEDRFTANITLNFAKFKVTYTPQRPDGSADAPVGPVGFDIVANVRL